MAAAKLTECVETALLSFIYLFIFIPGWVEQSLGNLGSCSERLCVLKTEPGIDSNGE